MQPTPLSLHGPTILVVEDEEFVLDMLCDALEESGFQVLAVTAAEDALGYAVMDIPFDAVITDINLAGRVDGWELAETLREMRPDLPIVYASAVVGMDRQTRGVPGSVFVPKPYNAFKICEAVANLLRARRSAAEASGNAGRPKLRLIA